MELVRAQQEGEVVDQCVEKLDKDGGVTELLISNVFVVKML
jgi:hypothetical protein